MSQSLHYPNWDDWLWSFGGLLKFRSSFAYFCCGYVPGSAARTRLRHQEQAHLLLHHPQYHLWKPNSYHSPRRIDDSCDVKERYWKSVSLTEKSPETPSPDLTMNLEVFVDDLIRTVS